MDPLQETEVERDTVAAEILRLKILLDHMVMLHKEAKEDNDQLSFCKRQLARLEVENPKVQQNVEVKGISWPCAFFSSTLIFCASS